jgi:DNA-binding transcriptional ArsR family regulator
MPLPSDTEIEKVLSSPIRRKLIPLFAENRPLNPKAASDLLRERLSTVSYHVRKLVDYHFLTVARKEPVRGTVRTFYLPDDEVLDHPLVRKLLAQKNLPDD